ncbi:hypothetical protein PV328_005428 [Microctonus aethiopoides]|uniref:RecA family profile 1 domain-containing protein n=1 Tax=Microctonus aethiopoides TaxID=144406 RepID=A0AA39KSD7_9HYME|nr:hypothetical protein PV328_005428 [Microctonus aethiopoides]
MTLLYISFLFIQDIMEHNFNIESGLQFLSRIKVRPTLKDIDKKLFPNGLLNNETVEISGNSSSGKTILMTQLIAKCILLDHYDDKIIGGLGVNVVFINTDHHFMIVRLRNLLVEMSKKNEDITDDNKLMIDNIVKQSMCNLTILSCYSNLQYAVVMQTLNDILLRDDKIGLVAIDSIAAYYWQDRENGGDWMMNRYIQNVLKSFQKHTFASKVPLIYTKLINDESINSTDKSTITCVKESLSGKINYRIKLIRSDERNEFTCTVQSSENIVGINYTIGDNGIMWSSMKRKRDSSNAE